MKESAACVSCLIVLAIWAGIGALIAWGIEWVWNAVVPSVFHGSSITYLQACALYFLVSLACGLIKGTVSVQQSSK